MLLWACWYKLLFLLVLFGVDFQGKITKPYGMNSFGDLMIWILGYCLEDWTAYSYPDLLNHVPCGVVLPFGGRGTLQGEGLLSGGRGLGGGHHGHLRLRKACFLWLAASEWRLKFGMSAGWHPVPLRPSHGISAISLQGIRFFTLLRWGTYK